MVLGSSPQHAEELTSDPDGREGDASADHGGSKGLASMLPAGVIHLRTNLPHQNPISTSVRSVRSAPAFNLNFSARFCSTNLMSHLQVAPFFHLPLTSEAVCGHASS